MKLLFIYILVILHVMVYTI